MLQRYLLGDGTKLTDANAADVNGDSEIDIFDLARMKALFLQAE